MALTAQTFKDRFPEFENLSDPLVTAKIEAGERACPESVFGDLFDDAVGYYAAQQLALSPAGRDMRLATDGATVYDAELKRYRTVVSLRGRLL